jgi:hypothetical protein
LNLFALFAGGLPQTRRDLAAFVAQHKKGRSKVVRTACQTFTRALLVLALWCHLALALYPPWPQSLVGIVLRWLSFCCASRSLRRFDDAGFPLSDSCTQVVVTSGGTTVPLEKNTVRFIDNFSAGADCAFNCLRLRCSWGCFRRGVDFARTKPNGCFCLESSYAVGCLFLLASWHVNSMERGCCAGNRGAASAEHFLAQVRLLFSPILQ